jgi:hypothetical membrane protein
LTGKVEVMLPSGKYASDYKRAGALLAFGGMEFLILVMVLEAIYPNYSVHANAISDLLAIGTNTSLIGEPLSFLFAMSWLVAAYYLFRGTGRRGLMALNLLPGLGFALAVLSPENVNVVIHSIGAVLAFIPGALAAILSYRMIKGQFRYFAVSLGALSLLGTVTEFGAYNSSLVQQTLGPGGWERVIVYPIMLWLVGFGTYLLTVGKPREGPQ